MVEERRALVGPSALATALLSAVLAFEGCGLAPENVSLNDPRVQPLLKAMERVDRTALGFTPVTTNARNKLELSCGTNQPGRELTLTEARPILKTWSAASVEPRPPDLYDEGFEPGSAGFLLIMVLVLIVSSCLALIIGVIGLAILTVLLAAGIGSTSLVVGMLRHSVSAGFRTLFIQLGALAGMIGGALATGGIIWGTGMSWNSPLWWVTGIAAGLLIGILAAWLFNIVWSRIAETLNQRFGSKEGK